VRWKETGALGPGSHGGGPVFFVPGFLVARRPLGERSNGRAGLWVGILVVSALQAKRWPPWMNFGRWEPHILRAGEEGGLVFGADRHLLPSLFSFTPRRICYPGSGVPWMLTARHWGRHRQWKSSCMARRRSCAPWSKRHAGVLLSVRTRED